MTPSIGRFRIVQYKTSTILQTRDMRFFITNQFGLIVSSFRSPLRSSCRLLCSTPSRMPYDSSLDPDPTGEIRKTALERFKQLKESKEVMHVPCIILEKTLIGKFSGHLKPFLLKMQKTKPMQDIDGNDLCKKILLNPKKVTSVESLGSDLLTLLKPYKESITLENHPLEVTYEDMKVDVALSKIIPDGVDTISSWSNIGHVVHLNLKRELLPLKDLIGQILLEKLKPQVKLVVNKMDTIHNEYRFFDMETLAQESDDVSTLVQVNAHGCRFKFDFKTVYWNPRLDTEHERIINKLRKGMDVLYDVCCGVGPFSIPIAKKKCDVLANDLNPESVRWLKENITLNKVDEQVQCFNLDGNDFIKGAMREHLVNEWKRIDSGDETKVRAFHVTMNLPAFAIEFLPSFIGFLNPNVEDINKLKSSSITLPMIHCYTFIKFPPKSPEGEKEFLSNVLMDKLGEDVTEHIDEVKFVRNVAPNKEMFRVSFRLPLNIALTCPFESSEQNDGPEHKSKKQKLDMNVT